MFGLKITASFQSRESLYALKCPTWAIKVMNRRDGTGSTIEQLEPSGPAWKLIWEPSGSQQRATSLTCFLENPGMTERTLYWQCYILTKNEVDKHFSLESLPNGVCDYNCWSLIEHTGWSFNLVAAAPFTRFIAVCCRVFPPRLLSSTTMPRLVSNGPDAV